MIGTERAFSLDPRRGAEPVLAAIVERFPCREGAGGARRQVFYDTLDGRLHRAGASLSARELEDGWRVAWRNGDGAQREERTRTAIAFASDLPPGRVRQALESAVEARRLLPLVEVELRGPVVDVVDDEEKTVVRLSFEEGRARAPRERAGWHELPPVLKVQPVRGYDREGRAVLAAVRELPGVTPTDEGTLEVALSAVGGRPAALHRPSLHPAVRADVGLKRVLAAELDVVRANEAGVRASLDTEFLHDLRVALRRSRALLSQLGGVLPAAAVERFGKELGWLARATGPTRDLDVFLIELDGLAVGLAEADVAPLREFLRIRRAAAHQALVEVLDGTRCSELLGHWRRFLDEPVQPAPAERDAARSLADVTTERARELRERVLRRAALLDASSPDSELHRLRLDCKKLRYVVDCALPLLDGKAAKKVLAPLKRLQDVLGTFNDCSVQAERLREYALAMAEEGRAPVGTLLAMGRVAERVSARSRAARRAFDRRAAEFAGEKASRWFDRLCRSDAPGDDDAPQGAGRP